MYMTTGNVFLKRELHIISEIINICLYIYIYNIYIYNIHIIYIYIYIYMLYIVIWGLTLL